MIPRITIVSIFVVLFFLVSTTISSSFVSAQLYQNDYRYRDYNSDDERYSEQYDRYAYADTGRLDRRDRYDNYGSSFDGRSRGALYSTYQRRGYYDTFYSQSQLDTYWPRQNDPGLCEFRQDLLLQVPPVGCQPAVVRSDLLEEQNVPVFCQIDSFQINPLVDIKQIRNIRFLEHYPPEVVGVGFHPARAALQSGYGRLLGSPLVNNIGYAVVVLRQQPNEEAIPDSVNVTLSALIEYDSGNPLGIGRGEFILQKVLDEEWEVEKNRNSFWQGRYFVRLDEVDPSSATVSIYAEDQKVGTTTVFLKDDPQELRVPGGFCQVGLEIFYDEFIGARELAILEVTDDRGTDRVDVYRGSRFLDNRCVVSKLQVNPDSETGFVSVSCGGERFDLELRLQGGDGIDLLNTFEKTSGGERKEISIDDTTYNVIVKKINGVDHARLQDGRFVRWDSNKWVFIDEAVSGDRALEPPAAEDAFTEAVQAFEAVADNYPQERKSGVEAGERYGERALAEAIDLAKTPGFEKEDTRARLTRKFIENYPDAIDTIVYQKDLNTSLDFDTTNAAYAPLVSNRFTTVRLVGFKIPTKKSSTDFFVDNHKITILQGQRSQTFINNEYNLSFAVDEIDIDHVQVTSYCNNRRESSRTMYLGEQRRMCDHLVHFDDSTLEESALIRVQPKVRQAQSETNFSVSIGIEKRAIELSPDKTADKIEKLNETIKEWQDVSDTLGDVVSGMKGACFATSAILTFKNFISGLSGEALARQKVMRGEQGWTQICEDAVAHGEYRGSIDQCFLDNAPAIGQDMRATTQAIEKTNAKIQEIQNRHRQTSSLFGESVSTDSVRDEVGQSLKELYGSETITMPRGKSWSLFENGQLVSGKQQVTVAEIVDSGEVTLSELRELWMNIERRKAEGLTPTQVQNTNGLLSDSADRVNDNQLYAANVARAKLRTAEGFASPFFPNAVTQEERVAKVVSVSQHANIFANNHTVTHSTTASVHAFSGGPEGRFKGVEFPAGNYVLGLEEVGNGVYVVRQVKRDARGDFVDIGHEGRSVGEFLGVYGIGNIREADSLTYSNSIVASDRVCKYYETEPYKGMPAVIPFDMETGWYVATQQQLPALGGIGAFDASGKVNSFLLCNVGQNGRVEFEEGFGDDICQRIDLATGQPVGLFPGLELDEGRRLVEQAIRAINDAANQYNQGTAGSAINVLGKSCEVGEPATGRPGTQCQDFMSPEDCHLLFNVCDPVICPNSRCDFGGTYPVADVVQTGIVGSVLLCLPNIREGIVVPVCLTGIKAGIDGFISILRSHQACLQEQLETGRLVGICDEIYSIYLCEFFWRQVAPVVNILLPKIIEIAYGQGIRGGGEYLTVMSAWQNAQSSVNYFTQSYAANAVRSFRLRNIEEAGGQFCKAFIGAKAPTAFKALIEPDSPPQFHAWFDSIRYSDATVPATNQYKVFYHIFAGNDIGTHFQVYLRRGFGADVGAGSGYYYQNPTVIVDTGFIPRGEFASQTIDFTAPEGYNELCVVVNGQEECGFKQVSTSFAINYLRDAYISDAATARVTTERECISGTPHPGALLNPNVQSGVEEATFPQIYERGVVRICATDNPGSSTEPERFVDIGYCDDEKLRCWIDTTSIDRAITDNNVGLREMTLQELNEINLENLQAQGDVLRFDEADAEIAELERQFDSTRIASDKVVQLPTLVRKIDSVFEKLIMNNHKARLILLRGMAHKELTRALALRGEAHQVPAGIKVECAEEYIPEDYDGDGITDTCIPVAGRSNESIRIIEALSATPYFDSERRLQVGLGGTIGSYGLNAEDELEWFNKNTCLWIDVDGKWKVVDNELEKQWLIKLKEELLAAKTALLPSSRGSYPIVVDVECTPVAKGNDADSDELPPIDNDMGNDLDSPLRRRISFIGSSINMFNDRDFAECSTSVQKAKEKGTPAVNLIPTFYAEIGSNDRVEGYYLKKIIDNRDTYVLVSNEIIAQFTADMKACVQTAYDEGMVISTTPHLDWKPGSTGNSWRNSYVFSPTQKINGYSYQEIILDPLANALLTLPNNVQADFAMQGEMGGTLFDYPAEWQEIVKGYKSRFNNYPIVRVGINTNYNKLSGDETNWFGMQIRGPQHDKNAFQNLLNTVEFVGFSAYEKVSDPVQTQDFWNMVSNYRDQFTLNGVSLPSSISLRFSESGIGGGEKVGKCTDEKKFNHCPWEGPLILKERACPTLWTNVNRELRRSYYNALIDFMKRRGVDSAYLWNLDTWDVQGIYRTSKVCQDEVIIERLREHNKQFVRRDSGNAESASECIEGYHHVDLNRDGANDTCVPNEIGYEGDGAPECELSDAQWTLDIHDTEALLFADEGDHILLVVRGNAECVGKEIFFETFENDLFRDDEFGSVSSDVMSAEGIAFAEWEAEYVSDGVFGGNAEFYFVASSSDGESVVPSGRLVVFKRVNSEGEGGNESEVGNVRYYNLRARTGGGEDIYLDDDFTGIFIAGNTGGRPLYVDGSSNLIGAITTYEGKINIPDFAYEQVSLEVAQYLHDIDDKFYSELKSGEILEGSTGQAAQPPQP